MPKSNQPNIGQNLGGDNDLAPSYPTPSDDVIYKAVTSRNIQDYVQSVYGTPPPQGTNPGYMLVNEVPVDWNFMKRTWATDRRAEDTYNYGISYAQEAKDYPIFTRDYIVRRTVYQAKTKLTALAGIYVTRMTAGGTGYADTGTTVSLSGGTGSGGVLLAVVDGGVVTMLVIVSEGNYTVAPTITITGTGTGATATAFVQPATALLVKEDVIRTPDSDMDGLFFLVRRIYETLPGPTLSGDTIDPLSGIITDYEKEVVASGTVTGGLVGGALLSPLIIISGGNNYTGNGTLVFSGGGGTGAAGTFTFSAASPAGNIATVTLTSGGGGFIQQPSAVVAAGVGGGSGAVLVAKLVGSTLASFPITNPGAGYTDVPTVAISDDGTGIGGSATANLIPTTVDSSVVDDGGSGYDGTELITFDPPPAGGTTATGTLNFTGDAVTSVTMTNNGSGYVRRPGYTIMGGTGSGAILHTVLTGTGVASITLNGTGILYQNPSAIISGPPSGTNATCDVYLTPTVVGTLTKTAGGSGYTGSATVVIFGGGGAGATGTLALATGQVTSATLTNTGSGYTSPPTITTSGGGGTGAVIAATIAANAYIEVEPLTAIKDLVMTSSIRLSSLPATKTFRVTFRVERASYQFASLIIAQNDGDTAVGLHETSINGGSGPVQAWMDEMYMTDSQYAAWVPTMAMSVSGKSQTYTLTYAVTQADGRPQVWTFRVTPVSLGTTVGIVDISSSQKPYGIRKVIVIYLTSVPTI